MLEEGRIGFLNLGPTHFLRFSKHVEPAQYPIQTWNRWPPRLWARWKTCWSP